MKTRNIASFLLIWLAAGILFTAESAQSHEEASWQKVEYTPADRTIESISIQAIDKTWYKVLVLTKKNQPPDVLKDIQATEKYGARFQFQIEGDFNKDGVKDKALVGVYKENNGGTGRSFLVFTRTGKNSWKKVFPYKDPGKPGFGILSGGTIVAYTHCMECGAYSELVWSNGKYSLKAGND